MKVIFMGTPRYAEVVLEKLLNSSHEVVAVICQPDKPVGRKQVLTPPPTKVLAQKHNIPVYQFKKIRIDGVETLKQIPADIMVTAAYGQILSQEILDITKHGVYNVHASVLPKYRGSSPIQWSLINGEKTIGITILKTLAGLDNGPILSTKSMPIESSDTIATLMEKLSSMGGDMMVDALNQIESGNFILTPQNEDEMTYFPLLKKEMSPIDFDKSAEQICSFVRGMAEWPVATINIYGNITKVYKAEVSNYLAEREYNNGEVVCANNKQGLIVKAKDSFVRLSLLQPQNSKQMKDTDYLNGKKLEVGLNITDKKWF